MNKEKIAEIYEEANGWNPLEFDATMIDLDRFATLVEDDFKKRLAQSIEQMPFGDTATSFAVYVRNFK